MWQLIVPCAVGACLALDPDSGAVRCDVQQSAVPEKPGIVYLIDGVGGFGVGPKILEKTLTDCGIPHRIRHFYWSHGIGRWLQDLTNEDNLRRKGSELADTIMQDRVENSVGPIYFVAKSGGAAVALRALAELPEGSVERVVLLSPAVSPEYDLTPALRAVRLDLVSFWSPKDKLILGIGTSIFGTADGVQSESAGLAGFRVPELGDESRREYSKLRQVEWGPAMRKTYNFGTHLGTSMPLFVRQYVAPLVGGRPDPLEP